MGTAGARAEASLGLDLVFGDREAGVDGNTDRYGDCNRKGGGGEVLLNVLRCQLTY